jgi:hypothetical protein
MIDLCSSADVKRIIDCVGRYTGTQISDEITEQSEYIYTEYGDPLMAVKSNVGQDENDNYYRFFYVGERNISTVERVFIGTATKRELVASTDYAQISTAGMIKFTSATTVGGETIDDADEVIIWYVPKQYKKLCSTRVAEKLLEKSDTTSGEKASKELEVIRRRVKDYEDFIREKYAIQLSSQYDDYDENYDTNCYELTQNFDANKFIGSAA